MDKSISSQARSSRVAILLAGLVTVSAVFVMAIPAPVAQYFRYFSIVDPSGGGYTQPRGISNASVIVGAFGSNSHGFVLKNGVFTELIGPGGTYAIPTGINASGEMTGAFGTSSTNPQGFILSGGTYTTIDVPGADVTEPNAINDVGMVVGQYFDQNSNSGNLQGFLYSGGTFTTLNFPGAVSTGARGINNAGQIVGFYTDASETNHAFIYSAGIYQNLFSSTCKSSAALGINNLGSIVGYCNNQAFVYSYSTHKYIFFSDPAGFPLPFGINDSGRVTGQVSLQDGSIDGFLAVPLQ